MRKTDIQMVSELIHHVSEPEKTDLINLFRGFTKYSNLHKNPEKALSHAFKGWVDDEPYSFQKLIVRMRVCALFGLNIEEFEEEY